MPNAREQEVRERAFVIWEQEGRPEGRRVDHWLRAEVVVLSDGASGIQNEGKGNLLLLREPADLKAPHASRSSAFQRGTGATIKDVLVCLNAGEASIPHLRLAANLTQQHGAHLTAGYLLSGHERTSDSVYGPGAIDIGLTGSSSARRHPFGAETAESHFRETLRLSGIAGEWYMF